MFFNDIANFVKLCVPKARNVSLQISIYCSIVSLALLSFDECPVIVYWVFPHRPSYFIALIGLFFFLASYCFAPALLRTRKLIAIVFLIILWGLIGTIVGTNAHCSDGFCSFFISMFTAWRVIPFILMAWIAMLFSSLPANLAKRYFAMGLLLLFALNAVHMSLEILANLGSITTKEFLININHYFRFQEIGHGWWPPVYFEGRVRGLFAEPSHMTSSLFVMFGLFLYKAKKNRAYYVFVLFLLLCYVASKSYSGLISLAIFITIMSARSMVNISKNRNKARIVIVSAFMVIFIVSGLCFVKTKTFASIYSQYKDAQAISNYCTLYHMNIPSEIELSQSRDGRVNAFNRMSSFLLDVDIAKQFPLGIGYVQRGFYWECLQPLSLSDLEIGLWVKHLEEDTYKGVPQLSEFGSLMSEQGFLGLAIFVFLYLYIVISGYSYAKKSNDEFVFYLTTIYLCMSISLFFVPLANFFIFYYLSGFLYGISSMDRDFNRN